MSESRLPRNTRRSTGLCTNALRRRLLVGVGSLATTPLWPSFASAATADPLELALRARLAQDGVGFAAASVGPDGLKLHTVGVMRRGEPTSVDANTLFELGSMTKAFVALLFADGLLKRRYAAEEPVESFLPDGLRLRDKAGLPIRMIDLATHRSGLPRMPGNLSPREMDDPYPGYSEARMFQFLREWKPVDGRGERFEYSNFGYGLLSIVLSRQLGLSFDEALNRHVLIPLKLEDMRLNRPLPTTDDLAVVGAALGASLALAPRLASPHDAERRRALAWRFDAMAGAVGLIGSITSVGRFVEAALGRFDHPLREAFAMCLQYRTEGEHPLHPFGFGWELSTIVAADGSRRTLFNQDGATAGFSTSMWIEPARQRGGVVLSNAFIETRSLALKALDPVLSEEDFNLMVLPADALSRLVGSYSRDIRYALDVRLRDGRLWMQETAQQEFELLPMAPRHFVSRYSALEFVFGDGDKPQTLRVLNGNKDLVFKRQ
ncbi:MAG: serine hydrolase [Ideonella sp.]